MSLFYEAQCNIKMRDDPKAGGHYNYTKLTPPPPLPSLKVYAAGKILWLEWNHSSGGVNTEGGRIKFHFDDGGQAHFRFGSGRFPPSPLGKIGTHLPTTQKKYKGTITLDFQLVAPTQPQSNVDFAPSIVPSLLSRTSANVCFRFPRTNDKLWMNEGLLRNESPYFEQLLSSAFAENSLSSASGGLASVHSLSGNGAQPLESSDPSPRPSDNCEADPADFLPYTYDDSDEELDDLSPKGGRKEETRDQKTPFKLVSITDSTYTTYLGVLCWICSRHISFAPLSSAFTYSFEEDAMDLGNNRFSTLESTILSQKHTLPVPASPKSVYRLSHLLMIPELAALALENFKAQLTPRNVAFELYSDVAKNYHEIRDVALEFAVEHWREVVKSQAWKDVERRAAEGESGVVDGLTGMLLSKALSEA